MTALTRPGRAAAVRLGAPLRGLLRFAVWTLAGFAVGIALALALPFLFDARPLVVLSGSMEPALDTGDVVVVQRIAPLDARRGDIVTFRDPEQPGRLVTHRVRSLRVHDGRVRFVTRGDANNTSERWQVEAGGQISRVLYRVPDLGHVLVLLRSTGLFALLFGLALAALLVLELAAIWRGDGESGERAA
jgi:signal peptidase